MHIGKRPILLIAALMFFVTSAGTTSIKTEEARGRPASLSSGEAIKVGVFMPLTGSHSHYGIPSLNGIKLATDEVNSAGGINGRPVELLVRNDLSDVAQVVEVVTELVMKERVHALLGEVASSRSIAAAPIAQDNSIPMVAPSSTNPLVTRRGDFIFRTCFTDPVQGAAIGQFAAQTLKAKRAALMIDIANDHPVAMAKFIRESFEKSGGGIVAEQKYSEGDQDFSAQLIFIKNKKPDVIFVPGYSEEAGLIARQAKRVGIQAPLVGSDAWSNSPKLYEVGGKALTGSYFSDHFTIYDDDPAVMKFVNDYLFKFDAQPDAPAATAYDAARILFEAIKRAGSTDGRAIRDALARTSKFPGVTGVISINAQRNADKAIPMFRIESDGNPHLYKRIVVANAPS
jgi:branched-chain amino acid transport system substrate-binding protein